MELNNFHSVFYIIKEKRQLLNLNAVSVISFITEGTYLEVYLTRKTWMDAKDSCGISQQRSSEKNRINPRKGVAHIHPAPPSHKKLDVWVSLIAITDIHTVQSK